MVLASQIHWAARVESKAPFVQIGVLIEDRGASGSKGEGLCHVALKTNKDLSLLGSD